MLYGVILDSARSGTILFHGINVWKRIVNELELPSETFELFTRYSDRLMLNICDCLVDILHEGTRDTYLEFFGQDFFRYFKSFGYDKVFRIAGRTFREFLFVIDQLHDSNRFTFPQMETPLFHVTEEDSTGISIEYKSIRHGFIHYAMGSILGAAKILFKENNIRLYVRSDLSTRDYTRIIFWIQFDNKTYQKQCLVRSPSLPDITGPTFFRVFPFSILMDTSLHIRHMGKNLKNLFPPDTYLNGRPLIEIFRLIRPNIHIEWDKILSYDRHIAFLMENRIPLRTGPTGRIRLKGQMKYLQDKNILCFLCHPVLESSDDVISAGLYLTDLSLYDGTSELLITTMHQTQEMKDVIERQSRCEIQLKQVSNKLMKSHERSQNLLQITMPKHIATMIQSGIQSNHFCESYPFVTVMFITIMNFKMCTTYLKPTQVIDLLNETINLFDDLTDKYDVFKIKTKMDASYMVVAGLHGRSSAAANERQSFQSLISFPDDRKQNENNSIGRSSTVIIAYLSCDLLSMSERLINPITRKPFEMKIGFHAGSAIGGLIGDRHLQYCLFGDAVTTARKIMFTGEPGRIHTSQMAYQQLAEDNRFVIEYRSQTDLKCNKTSATYWLTGINKSSSTTRINKSTKPLRCPFGDKLL